MDDLDLAKRPRKRPAIGITLFLASSFFFALTATAVKAIGDDQTTEAIVFWRNLIGLILLLPWLLLASRQIPLKEKLKTTALKLHLIRGICSFLSVFLYFYSLKFLDLSSATLLFNTLPIFIPIVAFIWKRIVIHHVLWWGIGVAFLGIILVFHPGKGMITFGSSLALLSGVIGAVSYVSLRLGHYSEPQDRMLFYLFAICMICAALFSLFSFKASWQIFSLKDLFLMILVGVFGFLYQVFLTAGTKHIPVRLGSVFIYFSVVFAFILDRWIWKTEIPLLTYIGFLLIVLGAVLLFILYPKEDMQIKPK